MIVSKQARCSDQWSNAADALSKSDEGRCKAEMEGKLEQKKRNLPRTLRNWIRNPYPDPDLGLKIVKELSQSMQLEIWEEPKITLQEVKESNKMLAGRKKKKNQKRKQQEDSDRMENPKKRKTER